MPEVVSFEWLRGNACASNTVDLQFKSQINEDGLTDMGDTTVWIEVPVPFVELPPHYDAASAEVASYTGEIGSNRFELFEFGG